MPNYSEEFKLECVGKLGLLNEKGTINLDGVQINNVRELVKFLGISSYSIYKWYKEIQYLARNIDLETVKKELEAMMPSLECDDYPKDYDDEMRINEKKDDVIDENTYGFEVIKEIEPMTFKMGTTFFQTLAQGLGIKNYRMHLDQLYLKIGTELIKLSGLVENGVREGLKIE